ncbi:hypothetical protein D3C79_584710 [compost metagenome]
MLLIAEQAAQLLQIGFDCAKVGLARKQFDLDPGPADLREHRRRAHFFGAHQHIRTQAQHPFGGQLALITDTRQRLERLRMLAGGIDPDQLLLAAQRRHPLAQCPTGADPALRQRVGLGQGVEHKTGT